MMRGKMKWFSSLRKALIPQCCKRDYRKENCESKDFGFLGSQEMDSSIQNSSSLLPSIAIEEDKLIGKESEQSTSAYTAAVVATAIAAEAAAAAVWAAAEVIRITTSMTMSSAKLTEEQAAIRIQSAFRGHQARASFQASRGLVRLRRVVDGIAAKSQTTKALHSLQTMSRVQMQLPPRYRPEEIHIPRLQKCELEDKKKKWQIGEGWDHGAQSKEQAEAKQWNRKEAALRRERALAYAFSHQWRSSSKSTVPVMNLKGSGKLVVRDPSNPQLGWSWLARLMAGKPWEKQQQQTGPFEAPSALGGRRRAPAAKRSSDSGSSSRRSSSVHSPATALSRTASSRKDSFASRRSDRCSPRGEGSAWLRRHSVAGLPSATDRDGIGRSPADLNKNHVGSTMQTAKMGSRPVATAKQQPAAARIRRLSLNK